MHSERGISQYAVLCPSGVDAAGQWGVTVRAADQRPSPPQRLGTGILRYAQSHGDQSGDRALISLALRIMQLPVPLRSGKSAMASRRGESMLAAGDGWVGGISRW